MLVWARRRCGGRGTRPCAEVWRIDAAAPGRLGFRTWTFSTELGIGIAIGMLAGTTGTHGSARGRMTLLAAVIGLVVGFLLDGRRRRPPARSALVGAVARLPRDQRRRRRRQPPRGQRRRRARLPRRPGGAGRRRGRAAAAGPASSLVARRPGLARRSPATAAPSANTPACASCASRRPPPVEHHSRPMPPPRSWSSPTSTRCAPTCSSARSPRGARRPSARCSSAACWSPTASPASPR